MVVKSLHMHMQWFHKTAEALCSPNGSFVRHIAIISLSFPSLLSTFPCSGKALCVGGTHAQAHHSTHDFLAYLTRYHPSNFTIKTPPQISLHWEKSSSQHKTRNKKLWKLMSHFTRSAAILQFSQDQQQFTKNHSHLVTHIWCGCRFEVPGDEYDTVADEVVDSPSSCAAIGEMLPVTCSGNVCDML